MKPRVLSGLTYALVLLLSESLVFAQQEWMLDPQTPLDQETSRHEVSSPRHNELNQTPSAFTQQELDQMLAPIALYPDALLSHMLMAATYPLEVVEAARWSKANPALEGEDAVQAVAEMAWDPSVKSLVAFPKILSMMDEKLVWMEQLGDAFLTQQQQVMETVQQIRQRASAAGNLASNDHVRVDQQGDTIVIEPADAQMVYVPYYDPRVMYGAWWWPAYPPVYWAPWPGYYYGPRLGVGFTWGAGISVGPRFFFGTFNWPHRHVSVGHEHNFYYRPRHVDQVTAWTHNPIHRRGVRYRNPVLHQRFGRMRAWPEVHHQFRGPDGSSVGRRGGFGNLRESRGEVGNRPEFREGSPRRFNAPAGSRSDSQVLRNRPAIPREFDRRVEPRGGFRERSEPRGNAPRRFSAPDGDRSHVRGLQSRPIVPRESGGRVESRGGFRERPGIGGSKGLSSRSFGGPRGGGGKSHHRHR